MTDGTPLTESEAREWRRLAAQLRTQQDADRAVALQRFQHGMERARDALRELRHRLEHPSAGGGTGS